MSEHEGMTAGTCYTHSLRAGLRQIDQPVLGLPGQTRSVLVFGQTLSGLALARRGEAWPDLISFCFGLYQFLSWPDSIGSCLGQSDLFISSLVQNRSVLALVRLISYFSLSWPDSITSCLGQNRSVLVLAKLYHFLSWTDSVSSCLGQNRSVLVLNRIDQLFSWTNSIVFCLCHTRSVLGQIRSVLDLGRFTQFLENSFLSLPDSISLGQISCCLYAIRSVLGKLLFLPDLISSWQIRLDQLLTNQFLSLPDSISSCAC